MPEKPTCRVCKGDLTMLETEQIVEPHCGSCGLKCLNDLRGVPQLRVHSHHQSPGNPNPNAVYKVREYVQHKRVWT